MSARGSSPEYAGQPLWSRPDPKQHESSPASTVGWRPMHQVEIEMSANSVDPASQREANDEVVADRSPGPPEHLRRRARILRVVNVPMRLLLRLPFSTPLNAK